MPDLALAELPIMHCLAPPLYTPIHPPLYYTPVYLDHHAIVANQRGKEYQNLADGLFKARIQHSIRLIKNCITNLA